MYHWCCEQEVGSTLELNTRNAARPPKGLVLGVSRVVVPPRSCMPCTSCDDGCYFCTPEYIGTGEG